MSLHTGAELAAWLTELLGAGWPTMEDPPAVIDDIARQVARQYLDASQHGAPFEPIDLSPLPAHFVDTFRANAERIARDRWYFLVSEGDRDWLPSNSERAACHAHARAEARKLVRR